MHSCHAVCWAPGSKEADRSAFCLTPVKIKPMVGRGGMVGPKGEDWQVGGWERAPAESEV